MNGSLFLSGSSRILYGPALFLGTLLFFFGSFAFADGLVNINTADKETLMTLQGIGEVKAQAIIDYREASPFTSIEDIQNVSGIGDATYNNIKDHITVSGGSSSSPSPPPAGGSSPSPQSSASPTPSPSSKTSAPRVAPPEPELFVDAGSDRIVIAGADQKFEARAYDATKKIVGNVRFSWNFGDGTTARGAVVTHHFAYPGRYAVVVTLTGEESKASDRLTVTAEEAHIGFSMLPDGGVSIANLGANDIDLSEWIIRSSMKNFFLPENSIILQGETLRLAPTTLGFYADASTEFQYPNGTRAYRAGEAALLEETMSASEEHESEPSDEKEERSSLPEDEPISLGGEEKNEDSAVGSERTTSSQVAAAAGASSWKWWMGALALAFAGAGSVYAAKRYAKREWSIIEE